MAHVRHMAAWAHHPTPDTRDNNEEMRSRRETRDNNEEMRARRASVRHNARFIMAVMRGDAACNGPEMAPVIVTCHES